MFYKSEKVSFVGEAVIVKPHEKHTLQWGDSVTIDTPAGEYMFYYMGCSDYGNDIYYRSDYVDTHLLAYLKNRKWLNNKS